MVLYIGRLAALLGLFIKLLSPDATAEELEIKEALREIRATADDICKTIPLNGKANITELSGDAKAKLSATISKVVDLGIQGAGKYQDSEYFNVLQQDLITAIKDNSNCRLTVWQDLKDKIIPSHQKALEKHSVIIELIDPLFTSSAGNRAEIHSLELYIDGQLIGDLDSSRLNGNSLDIGLLSEGKHNSVR